MIRMSEGTEGCLSALPSEELATGLAFGLADKGDEVLRKRAVRQRSRASARVGLTSRSLGKPWQVIYFMATPFDQHAGGALLSGE